MVDDSELDYIRTFLNNAHTGVTAKQFSEIKKIDMIIDTSRMLVFPPEILGSDGDDFIWKRYKIQVSESTEALMSTAINNILIGIKKFNKRIAIGSFTRPSTMCHMKWSNSTKAFENPQTKRWDLDCWIDIEWSTS